MIVIPNDNRWFHIKCYIGKNLVLVDIVAKCPASKDYILNYIIKVDGVVNEVDGITSKIEDESYMVSEITGNATERKLLREQHPRKLKPVNIRQHIIDSLNF